MVLSLKNSLWNKNCPRDNIWYRSYFSISSKNTIITYSYIRLYRFVLDSAGAVNKESRYSIVNHYQSVSVHPQSLEEHERYVERNVKRETQEG